MRGPSEIGRQLVHIGAGAVAFALRGLTWWQAAILALVAVFLNAVLLPRLAPRLFRHGDLDAPSASGIVIYPLAVLALILCFPHRLDIAATAWVILAAGDGFATLIGAHVRSRPLPWNRAKSTAGLLSFVAFGSLAGWAIAAWMTNATAIPAWWVLVAPPAAALVAGLVETIPIRLNDNISVPATAGFVLWSLSLLDEAAWHASLPAIEARTLAAIFTNFAVALAGWRAHTVTVGGAVAGAIIGTVIFIATGWTGWVLLFGSFVTVAVATRAGLSRKALAGIAEDRGGRRGPGNAIANTGLAAWAAFLSTGMPDGHIARLAMAAAIVTAMSDTIASEVGKAWGKSTWLVTTFRSVPPGTSGAISTEGTLAGVLSATVLSALAVVLGIVPNTWLVAMVVAATLASLVEGMLGATLEGRGVLDNNALNFINSAIGAGLAVTAVSVLQP